MKRTRFFTARNVAYLGVLLALVVVLQAVGGAITFGQVSLNFTLLPIVLGAILLGPVAGGILGLACGIVVLIQVIIGGGLYTYLWTGNPFVTTLTCLVKTTAAGAVSGLLYRVIAKKNKYVAVFVASGIVPIVNTVLFLLGMLCMSNVVAVFRDDLATVEGFAHVSGMDVFTFILVIIVTFNFFIEFAINLLLAPAVWRIEGIVNKTIHNRKQKNTADECSENQTEPPESDLSDSVSEDGVLPQKQEQNPLNQA